jgi:hypothetical protein
MRAPDEQPSVQHQVERGVRRTHLDGSKDAIHTPELPLASTEHGRIGVVSASRRASSVVSACPSTKTISSVPPGESSTGVMIAAQGLRVRRCDRTAASGTFPPEPPLFLAAKNSARFVENERGRRLTSAKATTRELASPCVGGKQGT